MVVADPTRKPVFAKKLTVRFNDFSGGLNDKFSPLLLADNEVSDIQNFTFVEKGTLQKRNGYVRRYPTPFGSGPVRGLYNYRTEDGKSRIVIACDGQILTDNPQFESLFTTQANWEDAASEQYRIDTTEVPGDALHLEGTGLGAMSLGGITSSLGGMAYPDARWRSPTIDITTVTDKTTGTVTEEVTLPAGTARLVETRVSPDGVTWDSWLALGGGNSIQSVGTRNFLQVRFTLTSTSGARASYQSLQIKFDLDPSVTVIASGLSGTDRYDFATMNDILWIVNGTDTNRKWDGTTFGVQGGSPPSTQHVVVHKNFMFLAGRSATSRSRLYFSDLANPESWPALNFIDVGKGDGDAITGLDATLNDQLTITKDRTVWVLQGDSPDNFVLRKATEETGSVHGKSFTSAQNSLGLLGREGYYFFDGVRAVLASEKIENKFRGMNQRQLQQVSSIIYRKNIWVALPEGASNNNNAVMFFDTLRAAWSMFRGMSFSEFVIWRQFNADVLLAGSSVIGQVYELETGFNDDGLAIDAYVTTKAVDFGAAELLSLVRRCLVTGKDPLGGTVDAAVSFFQNLGSETATQALSFDKTLNVLRALPGIVGIGPVHSLALKLRNSTLDQGLNIYSIAMEYVRKGVRATG